MHKLGHVVALVAAAGLAAGSLRAQDHPMPAQGAKAGMAGHMRQEMKAMNEEMEGMMHGMMGVHAYSPSTLLAGKTELALTSEQVGKLEGLAAEISTAKEHAKAEHDIRHARVIEQFKLANPDAGKVKDDGQQAMQEMATAHGVELSATAKAKGLLTDTQRAKVESLIADHGKMMHKPAAGMKKDK